jgi:hypothetical protein
MNQREWADLSAKILSAWPTSRLNEESLAEWYDVLAPYSVEAITASVNGLIRTDERPPSLARLLKGFSRRIQKAEPCEICEQQPSTGHAHFCKDMNCQMMSHVHRCCDMCYFGA